MRGTCCLWSLEILKFLLVSYGSRKSLGHAGILSAHLEVFCVRTNFLERTHRFIERLLMVLFLISGASWAFARFLRFHASGASKVIGKAWRFAAALIATSHTSRASKVVGQTRRCTTAFVATFHASGAAEVIGKAWRFTASIRATLHAGWATEIVSERWAS